MNREFVVLVQDFYTRENRPRVKGPMGPIPNTHLFRDDERISYFAGQYILDYVKQLHFIFEARRTELTDQSIYLYFDFWLVTDLQKRAFENAARDCFEFAPAKTFECSGERTDDKYWIAKVVRFIDCIDADRSYIMEPLNAQASEQKQVAMNEAAIELELTDELAKQFANYGNNIYRTFPAAQIVENLALRTDQIPANCPIFTPSDWPGHVICDLEFYENDILNKRGSWALKAPDLHAQYRHKVRTEWQ